MSSTRLRDDSVDQDQGGTVLAVGSSRRLPAYRQLPTTITPALDAGADTAQRAADLTREGDNPSRDRDTHQAHNDGAFDKPPRFGPL